MTDFYMKGKSASNSLRSTSAERVMRVGSTMSARSKMELFMTIVTEGKQLKEILKSSILDVSAVLDPVSAV